ncbi:tetratricopeptide repeat protein [Aquimarina agarivorans]|uniref:tetratricopeptide repeat protein n=1 Tax=Aquimarina agarivorans TaxID=980584 RepID=UPI000248F281|nr:hypothetical protein [Aquimarina agarivorans]
MKKVILVALVTASCSKTNVHTITNFEDYQIYLQPDTTNRLSDIRTNLQFWIKKAAKDTTQSIYLSKLAVAENSYFEATAKIQHLKNAQLALEKAVQLTDSNQVGLLHQLTQNYIKQHRFRPCLKLLSKAAKIGQKARTTNQLLFDIHLELGNDAVAFNYLQKFKNNKDFNYLIRMGKWQDTQGNLNDAIGYLKLALKQAQLSADKYLKKWSYSNLADFYGHQGNIKKSYDYYLKTLQLNPYSHYALKGIAWIAFSHEKNVLEANQILDTLIKRAPKPDYYLFKSNIAKFNNDTKLQKEMSGHFKEMVTKSEYGYMYHLHLIELLVNNSIPNDNKIALALSTKELQQVRETPMAYSWHARALAVNQFQNKAEKIIKDHVLGKTEEPKALLNAALVLNKNSKNQTTVNSLLHDLEEAYYELGPNIQKTIKALK